MAEFTFDDIYELLRAEKFSTDLQPVSDEQLKKIHNYFEIKKALLQKQKESDLFDKSTRDKLRSELDNARRAVKEFYERRERKAINRAIFTARTSFKIKDTTHMLQNEHVLYESLVKVLKESWLLFVQQLNSKSVQTSEGKPLKDDIKILKFVDDVPELLDSDLNKYGPFVKEQTANLPVELAELLVKQNKAVEITHENTKND